MGTKKKSSLTGSMVRELYDQKKMRKSYWGELEVIYQAKAKAIAEMGMLAVGMLSSPAILESIERKTAVNNVVKTMTNDLSVFANKLLEIREMHIDKQGMIKPEDLMLSYTIIESYSLTDQEFQAITITPMAILTAELQLIEDRAAEKAATDSNIVDVTPVNVTQSEEV